MLKIIPTKINKESLTTKLTLIIIGLTAGSALLIPATYASFHPVTTGEIADETILSRDIRNGQVGSVDIGQGQVARGDIQNDAIRPNIQQKSAQETIEVDTDEDIFLDCPAGTIVSGGGYDAGSPVVEVYANLPVDSNTWRVSASNPNAGTNSLLTAYVVCIGPMP